MAFDENSIGWDCSAFHLGYKDWIFKGVEYFLSHGPVPGMDCERFVKTPKLARLYVKSMRFKEKAKGAIIFKPLEEYKDSEKPEAVIFFVNPDQLSALIYLIYFNAPLDENRVVARFASACGSVVTLPLIYGRSMRKTAVWGLHDISARPKFPKDIMSLAMPFDMLMEIRQNMRKSFIYTARWNKVKERIEGV